MSGTVGIQWDETGQPVIGEAENASSILVFNAPDENGFTPGKDYSIFTLPCDLYGGYRLSPISDFVLILFWTGVIATFISMSHQSGVCHLTNPHKWLQIMQWATYIPEWVADLLSGLVDIIFAYALYIGMKQQTKPMSGLLITNIITVSYTHLRAHET